MSVAVWIQSYYNTIGDRILSWCGHDLTICEKLWNKENYLTITTEDIYFQNKSRGSSYNNGKKNTWGDWFKIFFSTFLDHIHQQHAFSCFTWRLGIMKGYEEWNINSIIEYWI